MKKTITKLNKVDKIPTNDDKIIQMLLCSQNIKITVYFAS